MLYRLTYLRSGSPRSITFAAQDLVAALEFEDRWDKHFNTLTLKPIGASKVLKGNYRRKR